MRLLSAIISLIALATSASGEDVRVTVAPVFKGEPLKLDSLRYQNGAGETFSMTRLSFLISNIALQDQGGAWLEATNQIVWLDAAKRRLDFKIADVPRQEYRAIRFQIGLDENENAADPATRAADHALNPALNGLHWAWQGGYIFLAAEGLYRRGNEEPKGYAYHLAREPFRTQVVIGGQIGAEVPLLFDVGVLFDEAKPVSFGKDGATTHSKDGDPVALSLTANLRGAFRLAAEAGKKDEAVALPKPKPLYMPAKFTPYRFAMSAVFPMPALPLDNPLIEERVSLGDALFHDASLSRDGSISCASCHDAVRAFTDPRRFSIGVEGRTGDRNGMPLFNLAWKNEFFWDGRAMGLRNQVMTPIQDHREMDEKLERVVEKLGASKGYQSAFERAFGTAEITAEKIGLAIESFVLTLTSYDSRFDRAYRGEAQLSDLEKRGFELFMTEREPRMGQNGADCFHCHGGALFTDHQFRSNGLISKDAGRFLVTGKETDRGRFSTPSLRNIELTGPYMHDGRFATLHEVLDHYSTGIRRSSVLDPNLAKHPDGGLHLTAEDRKALIAFLKTLTDERYRGR